MIDWHTCTAVERDPDRVGGDWIFRGARVPVAALFENLEDDACIHQFVEWSPGVTLEQARVVLQHVARSSLAVEHSSDQQVKNEAMEIPPSNRNPREGWAADSQHHSQLTTDVVRRVRPEGLGRFQKAKRMSAKHLGLARCAGLLPQMPFQSKAPP